MIDVINPILQWLNAHPNLAGFATFLISAGESIALLGTIIPGSVMMTAIGTLAGAGVIPLWQTIIWAIIGAILGDGISYWLGYHFKDRIRQVWPLNRHPEWLRRGEIFFQKHGSMSVFMGRFIGPVRAMVPLVAGMLGMRPVRFYIANVLSAIVWAPLYMLPGILLGAASLELPPDIAVHVILVLFLTALFFFLCGWIVWKIFLLIRDQINTMLNGLWNSLKKSHAGTVITFALKHHNVQKTHGQLVLAFYFIVVTTCFLWLANNVALYGSQSFVINYSVNSFFRSLHTPELDRMMLAITLLGEKLFIGGMVAVLFIWLFFTKKYYAAWHVLALGFLAFFFDEFSKHLVHSPRPPVLITPLKGYSFPSGHTTLATSFYIGIALLFSTLFKNKKQFLLMTSLLIAFLVGLSRIYLEAHWLTDVIGGWLLGAAILIVISISFNRKLVTPPDDRLVSVFLMGFLTLYSAMFVLMMPKLTQSYRLMDFPTYSLNENNWWQQNSEQLPRYRYNRFGFPNQILNLQWEGNLNEIKQTLLRNHWEIPAERDWISVIMRLSDVQSMQYLPLVSPLYLNKKPVLVLIKRINASKNLIVLRLWQSNIQFNNSKNQLWVGTIENTPRTYNWLLRKKPNPLIITSTLLFPEGYPQYDTQVINVEVKKHTRSIEQVILLIKPKK